MNSNTEFNYANLSPFLYLFITDVIQMHYKTYAEYAQKEPGYATPFLLGYLHAFQTPKDGRLSHALIQNVHKLATQHLPKTQNQPGKYRQGHGCFDLRVSAKLANGLVMTDSAYNTTLAGVNELIDHWFLQSPAPTHTLAFQSQSTVPTYFLSCIDNQLYWTCLDTSEAVLFDKKQHLPLIHQLLHDRNYIPHLFTMRNKKQISELMEEKVQEWLDSYHNAIDSAQTDSARLSVIAQHIQWLDQLHPFRDGNIRTCYILLNKLLSDYHLSPCILINPNKFDGCDHAEIVRMIEDGQSLYQRLLRESRHPLHVLVVPITTQYSVFHNGKLLYLDASPFSQVTCLPIDLNVSELLQQFCQIVLGLSAPTLQNSVLSTQGVFGQSNQCTHNALKAELIPLIANMRSSTNSIMHKQANQMTEALERKNYGLLFRATCGFGQLAMIRVVMSHRLSLKIDLNGETSKGKTGLDLLTAYAVSTENQEEKSALIELLKQEGAVTKFTSLAL